MCVVNTKEVDGFLVIVCQVQSIVCIPCHELVSSGFQHVSRVFLFHQLWYLCVWWSILYRLCLFSWDQQCSGCYGGRNRWETKCKDEGIRDIFYSTSKIFWPHLANMHQDGNSIRNMQCRWFPQIVFTLLTRVRPIDGGFSNHFFCILDKRFPMLNIKITRLIKMRSKPDYVEIVLL